MDADDEVDQFVDVGTLPLRTVTIRGPSFVTSIRPLTVNPAAFLCPPPLKELGEFRHRVLRYEMNL